MMSSYEESLDSLIQEARMEDVADLMRNKSLYLSFWRTNNIVGIKMELSTDGFGLPSKETPGIIEKPDIVCKWDIVKDNGHLPVGMGIILKDSKVYMIGGKHNPHLCINFRKDGCSLISSLSDSVYEFAIPDGTISPCALVPQLPIRMPAPVVVKHLGKTYVLNGTGVYDTCWHLKSSKSFVENCFLVLREDGNGMEWKSLPPPPTTPSMYFCGGIGNKLYVKAGYRKCCYDIRNERWKEMGDRDFWRYPEGSITLSLSVPTREEEGKSSYVVICNLHNSKNHRVLAVLVDGDGNPSRTQTIHCATGCYDSMASFKLIELECKGASSTFALVFCLDCEMIGLTVFRVTLCKKAKKVKHVRGRKRGSKKRNTFLEAEVLVNQRYITKDQLNFDACSCIIGEAFFY